MTVQISSERHILRVVFADYITRRDMVVATETIAAIETTLPFTPHRLTDASQVTETELAYTDILAFVERRQVRPLANPIKSAIVVSKPMQIGFARMFQTLNDHPQIEVQVFDTVEVAEAWLADT
jgi:hypothetical protein